MNLENQLLEKFQVEELEKRYEFSWVHEAHGHYPNPSDPTGPQNVWVGVGTTINL